MKAIGLLSGGLDSHLALRLVKDLGIEIVGLNFTSVFCTCTPKTAGCAAAAEAARQLGIEVRTRSATARMLSIVRDPPHGHGTNLNPCIDCRIGMFREALTFMREEGASFLVTGEVLGERPMSQRRQAMELIDRESGAADVVLRPLSAALLPVSLPEREGWVPREQMLAISGRSREPQIRLAEELAITDYPCPAGGCRLTDPGFAGRMFDLLLNTEPPGPSVADVQLLRRGRHFRLTRDTRAVVGRDQEENEYLESAAGGDDLLVEPADLPGPRALVRGALDDESVARVEAIVARYTCASAPLVRLRYRGARECQIDAAPAAADAVESCRVRPLEPGWRRRAPTPLAPGAPTPGVAAGARRDTERRPRCPD